MTFKRLSFLLLTVTCFFIAGCDFLTPTESTTVKDDVETTESTTLADSDDNKPDDNKPDDNQEFPLRDTIVPGVEAAGIKLGDTLDRVKQIYGEPDREDAWFLDWDPMGLVVSLDDNGRVKFITIYHPIRAKTAGGIGIGSTKQRVRDEFGVPLQFWARGNAEAYWIKGIGFSYDDAEKVDSIFIIKSRIRDGALFALVRIVPGVKAAEIELGDTLDRVKQIYGEPNREDAWFLYWDPMGLVVSFDARGHVSSLYISAPNRVQTAGGVGIGSTKQRVRDEFGRPEEITVTDVDERYWFWARGIEFTFAFEGNGPAEKVTRIQIFLPKR